MQKALNIARFMMQKRNIICDEMVELQDDLEEVKIQN